MILTKIILIAIVCIIFSIIVAKISPEFKLYFTLLFGIVSIMLIFYEVKGQLIEIINVFNSYNIKIDNFSILIKIVFIAYICDFISLICKDLNYESIGKKIEMAGKLIILVYSFDTIVGFVDEVILLVNG